MLPSSIVTFAFRLVTFVFVGFLAGAGVSAQGVQPPLLPSNRKPPASSPTTISRLSRGGTWLTD